MEVSANPGRERRKSPRTTLTKILYVNLDSGNGGIVLNISEGGLAFHSVAPLMHRGPVRLWFSLSNDNRFEVSGELIWSNQTKKTGGLRFTNLTDSDRAQLRSLSGAAIFSARPVAQPTPVHAGHEAASTEGAMIDRSDPTPYVSPVETQQPAHSHAFSHSILHAEEPPQPPPAEPRSPQLPADLKAPALTSPALTSEPRPPHADVFKSGYGLPGPARANKSWAAPPPLESSGPSLGKVFVMLIGALVLVAAGVVLYSHSGEVGAALVQLGERLQGRSHGVSQAASQVQQAAPSSQESGQATSPQATSQVGSQVTSQADAQTSQEQLMARGQPATATPTPSATDTPTTSGNSQAAASATSISPEKPSEKAQTKPLLDAKVAPRTSRTSPHAVASVPAERAQSQASAQAEDSDSAADLDIAERYLNGVGRSRNSAAAAQFLWAAVAKGNATAELTLAHLYLNGDGVGRSCEQARLLLQAAASKGDVEANETLANLSRERCR